MIKKTFCLTILFLLLLVSTKAQIQEYYDLNWEKTERFNATYLRTIHVAGNKYVVTDYILHPNRILISETTYSQLNPIKDGEYRLYYENGNLSEAGVYENGEKKGAYTKYYEDGEIMAVLSIKDNNEKYHQYWSINGDPVLNKGFGSLKEERFDISKIIFMEFRDSVLYVSYEYRIDKDDTVYTYASKAPEYSGGMKEFYIHIQKNLRYPANARRQGVKGRVYVQFIINEIGEITEIETIRGIGAGCDEESERVFKIAPRNWIPGEFENRKVKVRMILPITFLLG
jgi:TonB family protein